MKTPLGPPFIFLPVELFCLIKLRNHSAGVSRNRGNKRIHPVQHVPFKYNCKAQQMDKSAFIHLWRKNMAAATPTCPSSPKVICKLCKVQWTTLQSVQTHSTVCFLLWTLCSSFQRIHYFSLSCKCYFLKLLKILELDFSLIMITTLPAYMLHHIKSFYTITVLI